MAPALTFQRIAEGFRWRLAEVETRLPAAARKQLDERRVKQRVDRGEFNFEPERLAASYTRAWQKLLERESREQLGAFLEFGVFYGSSLACMTQATEALGLQHIAMVGFDSFEGMPANSANEDEGIWYPGQFSSSIETTRKFLRQAGVAEHRVQLVKGWFRDTATPETATSLGITKASVIMIDCDLYSSSVDALRFCESLIDRQAVIFFDDWHAGGLADMQQGERRAFEELLDAHPDLNAEEMPGMNYKNKRDPAVFHVQRA